MEYNQLMALKDLIAGEQQPEIVENAYKGSVLNPGSIGGDSKSKEIAKPNAKVQAKIGQKYVPKNNKPQVKQQVPLRQKKIEKKHQIWSQEEIKQIPIMKQDSRKSPEFEVLYRQKVGTEDVFLGLSGKDPSSNHCTQITYKIQIPNSTLKQISIDLTESEMVVQSRQYYLMQYLQYKVISGKAKAKYISDRGILEIVLPIIREQF